MIDAIQELYSEHGQELTRRARGILRGLAPAEDAVAKAFLRKIEGSPKSIEALVNAEAKSLRRDTLRRLQRETPIGLEPEIHDAVHPPVQPYRPGMAADVLATPRALTLEAAEFHADFDRAVRALPGPERDAFILTELRGLDQREAAAVLGVSQPTVHRLATAALDRIRKELS